MHAALVALHSTVDMPDLERPCPDLVGTMPDTTGIVYQTTIRTGAWPRRSRIVIDRPAAEQCFAGEFFKQTKMNRVSHTTDLRSSLTTICVISRMGSIPPVPSLEYVSSVLTSRPQ